jgi:phage terminase small subunit
MLTAKKQAFAEHYAVYRDGPAAYRHAYNVRSTTTAGSIATAASSLLADPEIANMIEKLVNNAAATSPVVFDVAAALTKWLEIAGADPDELIGLRVGCCRHCYGEGGLYQWHELEYLARLDEAERQQRAGDLNVQLPDLAGGFGYDHTRDPNPSCWKCRGEGVERVVARDTSKLTPGARLLYGGVKTTRDGIQINIADRQKALENACRIIGAFNDKLKLDGSIGVMAAVLKMETDDPQAAARAYQELMASTAA